MTENPSLEIRKFVLCLQILTMDDIAYLKVSPTNMYFGYLLYCYLGILLFFQGVGWGGRGY